jgi:hypothetical protein
MADTIEAPVEAENTAPVEVSDADVDAFFDNGGELPSTEPEQAEAQDAEPEQDTAEVREQAQQAETTEDADVKKDDRTVPYGALHEERQLRKEAKAEATELREKMARMEERVQMFQEAIKPAEPEVSFDDDPAEYLRKQAEQTNQTLDSLKQQQEQQLQRQQQAAANNQFMQRYQAAAAEYSEQNPQFQDAYQHLIENRVQEHMIAGLNKDQAIETANREEQAIVRMAFENGSNPAEKLVELAKIRGWNATSQEKAPPVDKVDQVTKGQSEAKTISKGGQGNTTLTLESLADLDGDEFDKAWEKLIGPSQ